MSSQDDGWREVQSELHSDPRAVEALRLYREALAPLLYELGGLGVEADDLTDGLRPTPQVQAVLGRWLSRIEYEPLRLQVISILGKARSPSVLAREFLWSFLVEQAPSRGCAWEVANAFAALMKGEDEESVVSYVCEPANGDARQSLVAGLGRLKGERVRRVLEGLLVDEGVAGHAAKGLRRAGARASLSALEMLLGGERAWVRKEAERSIAAIKKRCGD